MVFQCIILTMARMRMTFYEIMTMILSTIMTMILIQTNIWIL